MSFKLEVAEFAERVGLQIGVVTKKFAFDILTSVVLRTPVRTGRARGNWSVGLGSPPSGTTDKTDKSGSQAMSHGKAKINAHDGETSIFIANNLDYIQDLERGRSTQAPNGMVAVTMASSQAFIDKAIRESKRKK